MTIPALLNQQATLQRAVKKVATSTEKIQLLQQLKAVNEAIRAALKK